MMCCDVMLAGWVDLCCFVLVFDGIVMLCYFDLPLLVAFELRLYLIVLLMRYLIFDNVVRLRFSYLVVDTLILLGCPVLIVLLYDVVLSFPGCCLAFGGLFCVCVLVDLIVFGFLLCINLDCACFDLGLLSC